MPVSDLAAGGVVHGPQTVEQLFAGEAPIVTGKSVALNTITKYQVVALSATGVSSDLTSVTEGDKCVIAAQAATVGQAVPYYSAGFFNHAVLGWPAAQDTLAKRKLFFMGTPISVGDLALG